MKWNGPPRAIEDGLRRADDAAGTAVDAGQGIDPMNALALAGNAIDRAVVAACDTTDAQLRDDEKSHEFGSNIRVGDLGGHT